MENQNALSFTTTPTPLLLALKQVSSVLGGDKGREFMKLSASNGQLSLLAFDKIGGFWCEATMPVEIQQEGELWVFTHSLMLILGEHKNSLNPVVFKHDPKERVLMFQIEGNSFAVFAPPKETFENYPGKPSCPQNKFVGSPDLLRILEAVAPIVESKDSATGYKYVCFEKDSDGTSLNISATDTYTFGVAQLEGMAGALENGEAAVPGPHARNVLRVFSKETSELEMAEHNGRAHFRGAGAELVFPLPDMEANKQTKSFNVVSPKTLSGMLTQRTRQQECDIQGDNAASVFKNAASLAAMSGSNEAYIKSDESDRTHFTIQSDSDMAVASIRVDATIHADKKNKIVPLDFIVASDKLASNLSGMSEGGLNIKVYGKDGKPELMFATNGGAYRFALATMRTSGAASPPPTTQT